MLNIFLPVRGASPAVPRIIIFFLLESLVSDVRFALRWLRKSPGFTLVAVVSLAVGIGFNTTLFTVADALIFKPLPVAEPERLVDVFTSDSTGTVEFSTSSYADYLDLKGQNGVFEDLVGYSPMFAPINLDSGSRLALGEIVTGNYFRTLGVAAAVGRTIGPQDDVVGAPRVAMVSYRYWRRDLGSASDVVGRTIRIRGSGFTIVGVAPASFTGMVPVLAPELWVPVNASLETEPVGMHDTIPSPTGSNRLERRADRWMFVRGRLKRGKTIAEARANLDLLMARLSSEFPATNRGRRGTLKPRRDVHLHPEADSMIVQIALGLMTIVGLVLLIACANVTSMLLARASGRQKEIGIRLALGASRGRLIRQLVTEAVVMSFLGAVLGLLLAWWAISALAAVRLPMAIPLAFDLRIDRRVLLFTLAASFIAGVESVGLATRVPFSPNYNRWEIWIPGRHQVGGHGDTVEVTTVSPEYFKTIGVPILEGRGFAYDDRPDTPRVAVVNETLAHRFWPGESAVGKTFRTRGSDGPLFQIVGMSRDHKVMTIGEAATPFLHIARAQRPNPYCAVIARTRGDASALLRDMRRELLALEPNIVFFENQTMSAEVATTLFPARASAWLVAAVGSIAMLLAAVGLYGVIAYSVARRTREIGIRIALGARPSAVLGNVMRQGLVVAVAGLGAGCVFAVAAALAVSRALYGVAAGDPLPWISAAVIILRVSALPHLVPAWRADRAAPSLAPRTE